MINFFDWTFWGLCNGLIMSSLMCYSHENHKSSRKAIISANHEFTVAGGSCELQVEQESSWVLNKSRHWNEEQESRSSELQNEVSSRHNYNVAQAILLSTLLLEMETYCQPSTSLILKLRKREQLWFKCWSLFTKLCGSNIAAGKSFPGHMVEMCCW